MKKQRLYFDFDDRLMVERRGGYSHVMTVCLAEGVELQEYMRLQDVLSASNEAARKNIRDTNSILQMGPCAIRTNRT